MTPKERAALEQMLATIRDAAIAGLALLGPNPELCPKCASARWETVIEGIVTIQNPTPADIRYCQACGHEWQHQRDDLVVLQEGAADAEVPGQ